MEAPTPPSRKRMGEGSSNETPNMGASTSPSKKRMEEGGSTLSNVQELHADPQESLERGAPTLPNAQELPADPGERPRILSYNANIRDQVRRKYWQRGPCQPRGHDFPRKESPQGMRKFNQHWFDMYPQWLEYSISKDSAFCLCCYLFKPEMGNQGGGESFVTEGFSDWKNSQKLQKHVGKHDSSHNQALKKCQVLLKQDQHIQSILFKQTDKEKKDYRTRLTASIDCIRYLLKQGLAFRGRDESDDSKNRGNFLELLHWLCGQNESVKNVALGNAPSNCKLTSSDIQKDIVNAAATETLNVIIKDIGDSLFSILVDESRDISVKEQMAVALRYVDAKGHVVERFLGIQHVRSTTAISLKAAIEELFCIHKLSMSRLRGQGYDGASNMRGEFNGLKTLILKENEQAYYVHCFAHQLQLALVAVAKAHSDVDELFTLVNSVVNVVGGSCKRRDILRDKRTQELSEAFETGDLTSGQGLNQESTLIRPSDTRWGSHYGTLVSLLHLYNPVIEVLETILEDTLSSEPKGLPKILLEKLGTFDFIFNLHLMRNVLAITNELSQTLQRKDQDIVNAMKLVTLSKERLQVMRDSGWNALFDQVSSFCGNYDVHVPNMEDMYVPYGRPRRKGHGITNLHHYRVEIFYVVVDKQLLELGERFTETTTELLLCMACLNPCDSFRAFNKEKLVRLAQFYPNEFVGRRLLVLEDQLDTYIFDMRSSSEFSELKGISDLATKLVETKKHQVYQEVYLLLTLALIIPVATATVERAFSAMKIVKSRLRNKMGDQFMNDSLVVFIERDVFDSIDNEAIIQRFQKMGPRRGQL